MKLLASVMLGALISCITVTAFATSRYYNSADIHIKNLTHKDCQIVDHFGPVPAAAQHLFGFGEVVDFNTVGVHLNDLNVILFKTLIGSISTSVTIQCDGSELTLQSGQGMCEVSLSASSVPRLLHRVLSTKDEIRAIFNNGDSFAGDCSLLKHREGNIAWSIVSKV